MTLDIINSTNGITPPMWQRPRRNSDAQIDDDDTGEETLRYLERVKKVAQLSTGNSYSGSLGFDHAVYCYGATGRFHPAALLASLQFASELAKEKRRREFTQVREPLEEFLVRHKAFINILGHTKGSRTRSVGPILLMHKTIMTALLAGRRTDAEIIEAISQEPSLKALTLPQPDDERPAPRKKFSKAAQASAIVRELLATRARCPICKARMPPSARSKDHILRIEDGGLGGADNLRFTHPYCNTGQREGDVAAGIDEEGDATIKP
jgi:hypothetical protein